MCPAFVCVDLGAEYAISQVKLWHYHCDGRKYKEQKVSISLDEKTWVTVYDTGTGYGDVETAAGKTIEQPARASRGRPLRAGRCA